jgi:hypothetical protein
MFDLRMSSAAGTLGDGLVDIRPWIRGSVRVLSGGMMGQF